MNDETRNEKYAKKQWTLNKCMAFLMRFSFQFILLIIVENSQQQQKFIKLFIKFEILLWIETEKNKLENPNQSY